MEQRLVAERYRLLDLVGRGGMGRVWRARDEVLHREVAVKQVVPPSWLTDEERDELRSRALREARTAARIDHPNVVRVYDVVRCGDSPWIVMEFVPSRTLQDVLDTEGRLPPDRAAAVGLALLAGLRAAHTAGVLHRDVKPQNVLVAHDGRVLLTDFGLAVFDGGDGAMTRPGMVLGSPQYVAPERAAEGVSSVAADLWSLGATLHAVVEGRSPYARSTAMATLSALAAGPPDPAPHAGPLAPVLAGLLRRDPRRRTDHEETHRRLTTAAGQPGSDRTEADAAGETVPLSRPTGRPGVDGSPAEGGRLPVTPAGPGGDTGAPDPVDPGRRGGSDAVPAPRAALRRWGVVVVGVAVVVATAAGVGTALVVADRPDNGPDATWSVGDPGGHPPPKGHDRPGGPRGPAPGDPRVTTAARRDAPHPGRRPPPGNRPPPPFPCVRPYADGTPVVAAPAPPEVSFHPPSGWVWHADHGLRVAVPAGWRHSRDGDVACYQDPQTGRTLSVATSSDATADALDRLRAARDRARAAGTLPGYAEIRLGTTADSAEWECEWDTPHGDRLRAVQVVSTGPTEATSHTLGWITRDGDRAGAAEQFQTIRASLRPAA
ncbi:protein kinase domain-containing protein [Micromonospora sp. BQ11]|uniref:serine/threonine-protein kinase n=1 Tax=Micromonospora sp. BQ11 TaxID=3452212 RepID=UPI003F8C8400